MNINQLKNIKTVNIEERLQNVQCGEGTFKEILENVMSGAIIPLTNNSGSIIGISFDKKVKDAVEDDIEKLKFETRYYCKPIMEWVTKALMLKADGIEVSDVIENNNELKVVLAETGEIMDLRYYGQPKPEQSKVKEELPEELDIPESELDANMDTMKAIKKYLRQTYGHYLSGFAGDLIIEEDEYREKYHVSGIRWGRKM